MRPVVRVIWRDAIARPSGSGLSQSEFCKKEGLALSWFSKWKSTIRGRDALAKRSSKAGLSNAYVYNSKECRILRSVDDKFLLSLLMLQMAV